MAKYSYEFKKKVVMDYLNGKGGYKSLSKEYNIPSKNQLQEWVSAYKEFGDEGLKRSREKKNYSFDFKLHVVELYLRTEVSYQELAKSVGINNPPMITKWVNDYKIAGPDALRPKRKGRKPKVAKPKKVIPLTEKEKADAEYLKQLEEENLKLRIENAYLKELRRLRLEEEKPLKGKQE
jgi:transposase